MSSRRSEKPGIPTARRPTSRPHGARPRSHARVSRAPRVGFVSLGCPKALVDSERILSQLRAEGYEVSPSYREADLVVVNTCGFIDAAIDESLDAIGEALAENGRVVVTGCLGARPERIRERHPRVLSITGPHAYADVLGAVHEHLPPRRDPFVDLLPAQRVQLTPRHYAYLKIAEGCNNRCSFCIIPALRGRLASRPLGEVMREAEGLVASGVKELLVISQDTSAYGADLDYAASVWRGEPRAARFIELARALGELGAWVRLHYVYPYPHVDDVVPLMRSGDGMTGGLLPYLDIPFQHASPRILKLMKRPAAPERVLDRIDKWRIARPDIVLRSTFIVGFPGETQSEFDELLQFLEAAQLDRVGCFAYSPVDGAAANDLPQPVPDEVKEQRRARFMEVQARISAAKLARSVGATMRVLVDSHEERGRGRQRHVLAIARSAADAPEIDGIVRVRDDERRLATGRFAEVAVTAADEHDRSARVA